MHAFITQVARLFVCSALCWMSMTGLLAAATSSTDEAAAARPTVADNQPASIKDTEDYTAVPAWFLPNAAEPEAIFDAWHQLSTTKAVLTWGLSWNVMAGVLLDEQGRPLSGAMIGLSYDAVLREYSAYVQTDARGHFLIYAPMGFRENEVKNAFPEEPLRFAVIWPASALPTGHGARYMYQFGMPCE